MSRVGFTRFQGFKDSYERKHRIRSPSFFLELCLQCGAEHSPSIFHECSGPVLLARNGYIRCDFDGHLAEL
jgi:hypothetical protein